MTTWEGEVANIEAEYSGIYDSAVGAIAEIGNQFAGDLMLSYFQDAVSQYEDIQELDLSLDEAYDLLEQAEAAGELAKTHLEETYTTAIGDIGKQYTFTVEQAAQLKEEQLTASEQRYWELTGENVAGQGETRRRYNREVIQRLQEGELTRGQAAAQLAQGNVRKSGSVAGLLSETTRAYDIDIGEIDKQLTSEMSRYGKERDRYRGNRSREKRAAEFGYASTEKGAGFAKEQATGQLQQGFEHGLENLLLEDINLDDYFSGAKSLVDVMGKDWYEDTSFTRPIENEITRLRSIRSTKTDSLPDIVKNMWGYFWSGDWLGDLF
jgi:hypothetical protein